MGKGIEDPQKDTNLLDPDVGDPKKLLEMRKRWEIFGAASWKCWKTMGCLCCL